MAATLHISLAAEPIAYIGDFPVTNSIFTSLIVSAGLILFALIVRSKLTNTDKPNGIQNVAEWIVESLYNLMYSITNDRGKALKFFPVAATFFLYILFNNWLGLIPGVGPITVPLAHPPGEQTEVEESHSMTPFLQVQAVETPIETNAEDVTVHADEVNPENIHIEEETTTSETEEHQVTNVPLFRPGTADLNTTIAFALISIFLTQFYGVQYLNLSYFKKFFNFESPIMAFVGLLELVSEFSKILSFAFRLFGNIFAGEVLLVVIASLASVVVPMPFYGLEIFVGFVQALVFSMLTVVFFNMATQGHESH